MSSCSVIEKYLFLFFIDYLDIECGLPASIVHGSYDLVNGSVGYLSTVIYKCHEGYEMIGRAMLTCDIDERWNGPPPRCEPIECEELPEVHENARIVAINGTTEYGAKAEVVCAPGYKPDGPRFISCLSTGQWSAPLSPCIRGTELALFFLSSFEISYAF